MHAAGIDVVDIGRIAKMHLEFGDRLVQRLCTPEEIEVLTMQTSSQRPPALALAFGIKEAVIKATRGIRPGGRFTDIDSSALLTEASRSTRLNGEVLVRGRTVEGLPRLRHTVCGGGAVLMDPTTWLCWVMVEGVA